MRAAPLTLRQHLAFAKRFVRHGFSRPALALLPHLAAFAIMLATERTVTAMTAFVLAWSILNFFWLALTRRPVISGALSLLLMTLLVLLSQLKYYVLLLTAYFVELMIVDTDTVSFLFMIFPAVPHPLPRRPHRARDAASDATVRSVLRRQPGLFICPFGRRRRCRIDDARIDAVSRIHRRSSEPDREHLCAGSQAAAYHPHSRRVEFRHSHGARDQSAERLRRAFQVVRRQGAQLPSRGQWRSELVHRIQRAGGIVGSQFRPFCLFRHQDRGRSRQSRPADRFAALRLSHLVALSSAWRVHERTQLPGHHRRAAFLRPARSRCA